MESNQFDPLFAVQVAEGAARAAGALLRAAYFRPRQVADKGINSLVTESDRASEALLVRLLRAVFPMCGVAGEEGARFEPSSTGEKLTWWLDPLDGTTNFVHSIPRFSVSLGCADEAGNGLVGVVYDPMFDECFCAVRGMGATCNGKPIRVSPIATLRDSMISSGFPMNRQPENNNTAEWAAFIPRCQGAVRMGSAALDLCYVAAGRYEAYWEPNLSPWDQAAGMLIVQEAGGQVTDYAGHRLDLFKKGGTLASNGLVHQEIIDVMQMIAAK